jgi:hypothetical protein
MRRLGTVCCLMVACAWAGCSTHKGQQSSSSSPEDWPPSARAAVYVPTATPGFDSPEAVTRWLEQRWSLADIRSFCIPERRHNDAYQNLVITTAQTWKGRLYADTVTGFDRIIWYGTVQEDRLQKYSLEAYRGKDFWLLEIGSPESSGTPPRVAPDPSAPYFTGHR